MRVGQSRSAYVCKKAKYAKKKKKPTTRYLNFVIKLRTIMHSKVRKIQLKHIKIYAFK